VVYSSGLIPRYSMAMSMRTRIPPEVRLKIGGLLYGIGIQDQFGDAPAEGSHLLEAAGTEVFEVGAVDVERLIVREAAGGEVRLENLPHGGRDAGVGRERSRRGGILRKCVEDLDGVVTGWLLVLFFTALVVFVAIGTAAAVRAVRSRSRGDRRPRRMRLGQRAYPAKAFSEVS
jgi:hypothetical protein